MRAAERVPFWAAGLAGIRRVDARYPKFGAPGRPA